MTFIDLPGMSQVIERDAVGIHVELEIGHCVFSLE